MKASLVFAVTDNQILLATKAEKIGAGLRNGYGGGHEPFDKSMRHTGSRELDEESGGIKCRPEDLIPCAVVSFFFFKNKTEIADFIVHIFLVRNFSGSPSPTSEMVDPVWFPLEAIPYEKMLPGDRLFLPKVLAGEKFTGRIRFNEDKTEVLEHDFQMTTEKNLLEF